MKEGSSLPAPTEPTKEEAEALPENGSHEDPDDIKIYVEKPQQPKRHSEQEQNYRNYKKKLDIRRLLLLILAPLLSTVLLGLITITFLSLFFRLGNLPFVFFVLMVMMRLLLLVRYKKDIKKGLTFSVRDPISVVFNFISGRAFGGNWIQVAFPTQRIVTLGRPPSK